MLYMKEATKVSPLVNEATPIKAWRTTGIPLLITERPPSLYCSIHPINQMHHTCIKNLQDKRQRLKLRKVYQLCEDPETKMLRIRYLGNQRVDELERK